MLLASQSAGQAMPAYFSCMLVITGAPLELAGLFFTETISQNADHTVNNMLHLKIILLTISMLIGTYISQMYVKGLVPKLVCPTANAKSS